MKSLPRKYRILSVALISLGILFLPGYILFYHLSEIDFLRSALNWENPDDVDQGAAFEKKGKMAQVNVDSIHMVAQERIFISIWLTSSQQTSPIGKSYVPRC